MADPELLFEQRGRAGLMTLNRPKALNALTLDMARSLHHKLAEWERDPAIRHVVIRGEGGRAFCAGGDIRALYEWGRAGAPEFLDFYRTEYRLNIAIKRFGKPFVALMDGITMGGGVGVSVHGSHRVATERLMFAMPEVGIGLFPDVGGTYFLPRCPGETGTYLALSGVRIGAADALYAGIATHHVASDRLAELTRALCFADDVDACLAGFAADPGHGTLAAHRGAIDRHFLQPTVEAVIASLEGGHGDFARATVAELRAKSPTSLKITLRQLREGASLTFEECMAIEFRMVNRILHAHDFFEGVRAVVIDKDQSPRWHPATLEEVGDADVAAYFAPLERELLP